MSNKQEDFRLAREGLKPVLPQIPHSSTDTDAGPKNHYDSFKCGSVSEPVSKSVSKPESKTLPESLRDAEEDDVCVDGEQNDGVYGSFNIPEESWFYPGSDRQTAEKILLNDGRVGSYLARCSKTGDFALSVRYKGKHNVAHFKIHKEENNFFLNKSYQFPSLTELIDFLQKNESMLKYFGETVSLKYPMDKN